jgi:hypothetical protein
MRYSLLTLAIFVTLACVYFALMSYGWAAFALLGGALSLGIWQVIQFARELRRP